MSERIRVIVEASVDRFIRDALSDVRVRDLECERTAALDLARMAGDVLRGEGTESEIREAEDVLAAAIERRRA